MKKCIKLRNLLSQSFKGNINRLSLGHLRSDPAGFQEVQRMPKKGVSWDLLRAFRQVSLAFQ